MTFHEIIQTMIDQFGSDILNDSVRFKAIFFDFAPKMEKEKKIIRRISEENRLCRFLDINNCKESDRKHRLAALYNELVNDVGLSDEWTLYAVKEFAIAFGWNIDSFDTLIEPFIIVSADNKTNQTYVTKDSNQTPRVNTNNNDIRNQQNIPSNKTNPIPRPTLAQQPNPLKNKLPKANPVNATALNNAAVLTQIEKEQKKKSGYYIVMLGGIVLGLLVGYFIFQNKKDSNNLKKSEQTTVNNGNNYSTNMNSVSEDYVQYWGIITSTYSEGIAIHPEPKKDSEVLGRIPYQEVFPIYFIEPNTTYGYTNYNGIEGYINLDYAEIYDPENDNETDLIDYGIYKNGHGISSYDYVLPESSSKYLTRNDIANLTLRGVNYAKNEIYARYGRDFKSQELRDFFASRSWYNVSYSLSDETDKKITAIFNEYEKENSKFLDSIEKEMGTYNLK